MKRKIIGFLVIVSAIFLLTACSNNVNSVPSATSPSAAPATVYYPANAPQPSPSPSPSPDVNYIVKTDYSQLTPYEPPEEIYTRLSEDYMPELVPSDDYGRLLPYAGAALYALMGWWDFNYGLVTVDSVIVTDAVYASAYQARWYDVITGKIMYEPYYILELSPEYSEKAAGYPVNGKHTVATLNGSWVTPQTYEDIVCNSEVMMLFRDIETNDVDVMDYSGKMLYNTKTLECYDLLPPYSLRDYEMNNDLGEGYYSIRNKENVSLFHVSTGTMIDLGFSNIYHFNDGLAPIEKNGLWGYIDTGLNEIIPPQYRYAYSFINGMASVTLDNGFQAVIDKSGNILLSGKYAATQYGSYLEAADHEDEYHIYDLNRNKIFSSSDFDHWERADNWSYFCRTGGDAILFYGGRKYELPGYTKVTSVEGNYFIGIKSGDYVLSSLNGKVITHVRGDEYVQSVFQSPDGGEIIIVSSFENYSIVRSDGETIFSGTGNAYFDENNDLICIKDRQFFAYANTGGKVIFRVSLLMYHPD